MTSLTNRVATFILLIWFCTASAICPLDCFCRLDERGRRKTSCLQGGIIGPLPVSTIDKNTQVLEIKPPDDNPNWLLIGAVFQTLTSLEELHVVKSNVPEIGKHSFWGVKGLEVLNLMENNISAIQDHNFRGLANLRELYLNDNRIENLMSGSFKYLTDLRVLNLARNRIEDLMTRVFERLGKLQKLNLSGNKLGELHPEVFMDVQELRVLECRNCGLRNINTQIYHLLQHLTTLDLGDNDFFYLTNDEFHDLRKLKYLWLDGNHLPVVLEKTFVMQKELLKVSLARNRLAKVTNTAFVNVTTLVELDISYNKLIRIEPAVFHPISETLEKLDVSGNNIPIAELKYGLQGLGNLRHLGLADLNLSELPVGLLLYHERLKSLNLSGNLIQDMPSQMPHQLTEVDLSRNKFAGLEEKALQRLDRIPVLHLSENPWSCDLCNIVPLLGRVNKSTSFQNLKCASPKYLRKRTLGTLKDSDLKWCSENDALEADNDNFFANTFKDYGHVIIIVVTSIGVLVILFGSIACVRVFFFKRRPDNYYEEEDKRVTTQTTQESIFENATATAIFGQNGEISFKFPLELKELKDKKVSISTIDDMKKETKLNSNSVPNGEL